ncbi:hypothetical protein [Algoriphagus namhaensis]
MNRSVIFIWICYLVGVLPAGAQQVFPEKITEIPIAYLDLISFDTKDQLYASTTSGDIYLFDSEGKQLNLFSPERQGRLDQLEASWTVNIFSFSSDLQEYRIYDRFLNPLATKGFLENNITIARAATLGNNNVIWVYDESDMSLKSLDYLRNQVLQSQPINLIIESIDLKVSEIREFKNRVFMNIPSDGVFIFDNQGNLIQNFGLRVDQRLCFFKEYLFWIQNGDLMCLSLATQAMMRLAKVPETDFTQIQIGVNHLAMVSEQKVSIYPIPFWIKNLR